MPDFVEATVTHEFFIPVQKVFDAWLDTKTVRLWMKEAVIRLGLAGEILRVEIDPTIGGSFTFSDRRDSGEAVHWGSYTEIDSPRKLAFGWFTTKEDEQENTSLVTLIFSETASGCLVTLNHTIDTKYAEFVQQTENGWKAMLASIDALLGPDS